MEMAEAIKQALLQADPDDVSVWNTDGQVKLEYVQSFVGSAGRVTRADVDSVAPGFTRAAAKAYRDSRTAEAQERREQRQRASTPPAEDPVKEPVLEDTHIAIRRYLDHQKERSGQRQAMLDTLRKAGVDFDLLVEMVAERVGK